MKISEYQNRSVQRICQHPAYNKKEFLTISIKKLFFSMALFVFVYFFSLGTVSAQKAEVSEKEFGKMPDGTIVKEYTLKNKNGMVMKCINYGTIVTVLEVPDKQGKLTDVVLGFDSLAGYLGSHPYFGATAGRVANRIANGKYTLDGKEYTLPTNDGKNTLHGGKKGFDKVFWEGTLDKLEADSSPGITFTYTSKDGEEGHPGEVKANVHYALTNSNGLQIIFTATTNHATPINLAHHGYFNLAGHNAGDILGHEVVINADEYTPTDSQFIPTGKIAPVKGTPFDFTLPKMIGKDIAKLPGDGKGNPGGYDLNYVLRKSREKLRLAAVVTEPKSGRELSIFTNQVGLQFYTGNFLDGSNKGKGGAVYKKNGGFCMETQVFPDSVNHPNFPSSILKPGETYRHIVIYEFSTKK